QKTAHGYRIHLRKSKTDQAGNGLCVPLEGEAAAALTTWLVRAGIREGRLFRSIRRNGRMNRQMTGKSINAMIKKRIEAIGLDPKDYGAHSLRAGFITSAIEAGMPLHEIVRFSGHRDRETAQGYVRTTRPLPATLHTLFSKEHIK
ncbi:MAG TPA: integrase, partial [Gammaproteobacteria bacterium]|nr:integrase [Gammaproteobacteria bacterium]